MTLIYELDLYILMTYLYTKSEVSSLTLSNVRARTYTDIQADASGKIVFKTF